MRSMGLSLAKIKETLELLGSASISLDSKERYCKVLAGHLDELHERQQRILKEIEITRSRISELSEGAISMGDSRQIACPASF
jgi:DNA-binding transcriptional MerR regulator